MSEIEAAVFGRFLPIKSPDEKVTVNLKYTKIYLKHYGESSFLLVIIKIIICNKYNYSNNTW